MDYTLTFRRLVALAGPAALEEGLGGPDYRLPASFDGWLSRWRARLERDPQQAALRQRRMCNANPVFIPRNHLVEEVIAAAVGEGDFAPFRRLHQRLRSPFDYAREDARFALPPTPEEVVEQTFCGT